MKKAPKLQFSRTFRFQANTGKNTCLEYNLKCDRTQCHPFTAHVRYVMMHCSHCETKNFEDNLVIP